VVYTCGGKDYEGICSQWDIATNNDFEFKCETAGENKFTGGHIYSSWWGSALGADKTTDNPGQPNLNAPILKGDFSTLPDFTVNVEKGVEVTGVKLDASSLDMVKGESRKLTASVEPEDAPQDVKWTTSNDKAATVASDGTVKAVGEGDAVITAAAGNFKAECKVSVKKKVIKITTSISAKKVYPGDKVTITVKGFDRPEELDGQTIHDEKIAYDTDIPNLSEIKVNGINKNDSGDIELTFDIPADTPRGTYHITNGRYHAHYGGQYLQGVFLAGDKTEDFFKDQFTDFTLEVGNRAQELAEAKSAAQLRMIEIIQNGKGTFDDFDAQNLLQKYVNVIIPACEDVDSVTKQEAQFEKEVQKLKDSYSASDKDDQGKTGGSADKISADIARNLIKNIPDPNKVTLSDETAVRVARAAYDAISADAKKQISDSDLKKLTDAEAAIKTLKDKAAKEAEEKAEAEAEAKAKAKIRKAISSFKASKVKGLKVKNGRKRKTVKVTFRKLRNAAGYQISYRKGSGKWKTRTVRSVRSTVKSLKRHKTYKFRVRGYRKINGKKYYSKWSAVKKIRTK
ncbi:MAG: Ig-like domain-containing protein, partial [Anaerovoracaceae bacterium]